MFCCAKLFLLRCWWPTSNTKNLVNGLSSLYNRHVLINLVMKNIKALKDCQFLDSSDEVPKYEQVETNQVFFIDIWVNESVWGSV